MSLITLTTDFGTSDWFAGTLHGVILSLNPRTRIIDITHAIPAGDIRAGAFALRCAAPWFPKDTVHVAVVDPGVGGSRPAIAVRTATAWFVGPDNGVLSWAIAGHAVRSVRRLENPRFFLPSVSTTFHGRDIFAPVAAHLARGRSATALGPRVPEITQLSWPEPRSCGNGILGEVIYIDRFGNALTNIESVMLGRKPGGRVQGVGRRWSSPLATHYAAVPSGASVAVRGSSGFLEIAVNQGSAVEKLRLKAGDPVRFIPGDRRTGSG